MTGTGTGTGDAENAGGTPAVVTPSTPATTTPGTDEHPRYRRWRKLLVGVLLVLGCILAPLSVAGVWLHGTLLDTDQYVSTIAPLASDPHVQQSVADRVSTAIVTKTDAEQRLKNALPERAKFAAPAITQGFETFVHSVALKFTQSDQFQTLWENINRRAHTLLVNVLKGSGTETVATKNGQVVLQLGPVVEKVNQALVDRGVNVLNNVDPSKLQKDIVLIDSSSLRSAQSAVKASDKLAIALPIITVLFFAAAIWLSRNRRKTLLHAALGIALAIGLVLVGVALGRDVYLNALGKNVNQDTAGVVYDQLLSFLKTALRTVFVLGIVVAIAAWLAGPGSLATRIRGGTLRLVRREPVEGTPSAVAAFAARHRNPLRVFVIAIGFILLVALSHPGPWAIVAVALIVLALLLLIEFLASRGAVAATDGGTSDEVAARPPGSNTPV
jgi:hypothetical protein